MKQLISQGLLLLAEIGVIVVMLIIIVRERKKIKERQKKNKRPLRNRAVAESEVVYLD
jgi:DNA polymerase elongation subunit (family B)